MITANTRCAPNWVDLATSDIESAVAFYEALFGWITEQSSTPLGDYYMAKTDGHQVAGMMQSDPKSDMDESSWTVFFNVEDVDDMAAAIVAAGGAMLQAPFDIPEARIAVVADPLGAEFGLFAGPDIDGIWMSPRLGGVCWVETMNRDALAAESFYATVFGWKAETQSTDSIDYTVFMLDGDPVAGMIQMPDEMDASVPAHWGVYFTVPDCADVVERAVALGGSVLRPVTDTEMGPFAVLADPEGAVFEVMEFAR